MCIWNERSPNRCLVHLIENTSRTWGTTQREICIFSAERQRRLANVSTASVGDVSSAVISMCTEGLGFCSYRSARTICSCLSLPCLPQVLCRLTSPLPFPYLEFHRPTTSTRLASNTVPTLLSLPLNTLSDPSQLSYSLSQLFSAHRFDVPRLATGQLSRVLLTPRFLQSRAIAKLLSLEAC